MAYVKPNTFSSTNSVDADKLNANFIEGREYLNAKVVVGDIEANSIKTENLVVGEPVGVNEDYYFLSGDLYTAKQIYTRAVERAYFTATVKTSDYFNQVIYQPIPETGKRFYLEKEANVIYEAFINVASPDYPSENKHFIEGGTPGNGIDNNIWLEIDGVINADSVTKCYHFHEDAATPSSSSFLTGMARPVLSKHRSRPYTLSFLITSLAAGWHDIRLVINPRTEKCYTTSRQATIETFYKE